MFFGAQDEPRRQALAKLKLAGLCFHHELGGRAWTAGEDGKEMLHGRKVPASALTEMAVMVCQTCPVQYDCTRYAVEYAEAAGTWGCRRRHLEWLFKRSDAMLIIGAAEAEAVPVEQYVAAVRVQHRAMVSSPA